MRYKMHKIVVTLCLLSGVMANHKSGHTNNWAVLVSFSTLAVLVNIT